MILLFPDLDTLRLTLTSTTVPADVTLAPAAVSFDDQGRVYVEPTVALSKATAKTLDRLGVKGSKRHATDAPAGVVCWAQVLPADRAPGAPALSSQTAVLFDLGSADDLPALVTEMLRLGNDRQAFRWFTPPGQPDASRVLLRAVGPPYYTLLRVLDRAAAGTAGEVRGYVEQAPRVWVEIGYTHPLAAQFRVADGQLLLIRPPREWLFLDEAPFQDVYDALQFDLPAAPVGWAETDPPPKMAVPLRLAAGNAAEPPDLWVLRGDPVGRLDRFVREADDQLVQRLMFAVATDPAGRTTVALRTRPSKNPPPALPLEDAVGFRPFWKLPNLYLPAGQRVHPTLRRDAVRRLLADDPDQVVWLYPDGRGGFTPEAVPDAAFRSLEDWVDYVIEAERGPLSAWIEATRFDFDHFVCKDPGDAKPRPDKGDKDGRGRDPAPDARAANPAAAPVKAPAKGKPAGPPGGPAGFVPAEEVKPPSEWKIRLKELEDRFLAADGPLDAADRVALWPDLAAANAGAGDTTEAAVCWLNALWQADPPPEAWLAGWARAEFPGGGETLTAAEFDKRLRGKTESVGDHRAVVAGFLRLAAQDPVPGWLVDRLPAVQKYLEGHENGLPVRAAWLAWYRVSQLSGADVLGLARARDRVLNRLLTEGLSPERDLPSFLRFAGLRDAERMRVVKEKSLDLHKAVRDWVRAGARQDGGKDDPLLRNLPYVDLMFAFALARLGEDTPARRLLDDARREMEVPVPQSWTDFRQSEEVVSAVASNFLYHAFRYRVEQVLAGKVHSGQLPQELLGTFDEVTRKGAPQAGGGGRAASGQTMNPYAEAMYTIQRLRKESRILEPHERLDPYRAWTVQADPLRGELTKLHEIKEPGRLADRVRRLLREPVAGKTAAEVQFAVLHEALPLSPRAGEGFTVELLNLVPAALAAQPGSPAAPESADALRQQGELLERALFLAGHFDRADVIPRLVEQFTHLVRSKKEDARFKLINAVAGPVLRSLKKLGLRDQIDRFLGRLQSEVLQGAALPELRKRYAAKPESWGVVLNTMLNLAGGWLTFGLTAQATPILDEARAELLGPNGLKLPVQAFTDLVRTYIAATGQGPSDTGLPRVTELFRKIDPAKITNTMTTSKYYSRFHLNVVEEVVLAMVSDEFALGPAGRRWLDDDEYLVRRRVHADMKRHLDRSGL